MSTLSVKRIGRKSALLLACLSGFMVANPAMGQGTTSPAVTASLGGPTEEIIVTPQRQSRSTIGAPIRDVTLSEFVPYDDLNLSRVSDIIALRHRVRDSARRICSRLQFENPVGTPDTARCRRDAVDNARSGVDAAIYSYPARSASFTP